MEKSTSEQNISQRCPCGFWGSSETQGLCSLCYKEQNRGVDSTQAARGRLPVSAPLKSADFSQFKKSNENNRKRDSSLLDIESPQKTKPTLTTDPAAPSVGDHNPAPTTTTTTTTVPAPAPASELPKTGDQHASNTSSVLGDKMAACSAISDKMAAPNADHDSSTTAMSSSTTSKVTGKAQKSLKRCHRCNCKLEPAIREIGRCKCEYIFCQLHRLAEQHSCSYDHKENGRSEAREKMVPAVRYLGNNVKRI